MKKLLKFVLRVLLAPFFFLVTIVCRFASFIVGLASGLLGIVALVLAVLSVFLFITDGFKMGILALIAAIAVSPFGVPLLAQLVLEFLLSVKNSIRRVIT